MTLNRIQTIHPLLRDELNEIYKEILNRGVGVRFTDVLRSFETQRQLYAKGRTSPGPKVTYAKEGRSYHNYGLAVDIVLLRPDKSVSWDIDKDFDNDNISDWLEIVSVFKEYGWKWGGDWSKFKDYPHFEKNLGYTINQLESKYKNNEFTVKPYLSL
ncbi:hypothetical protein AVL50_11205 [Flammeovirga sp. SJP92]|nr:hypothetical protein AVL50_11205 [Flammeovirga sp. SJP92]